MKFIRDKVLSQVTRGLFMASGAVSPVEIAARCGYDWLLLDTYLFFARSAQRLCLENRCTATYRGSLESFLEELP